MMLPWLIGAGIIALGAAVPLWQVRARKRAFEGAQASARAAVERLAFCVETLFAGRDAPAERLLADARERWTTAGALLSTARTPDECRVAERTAAEGLARVAEACRRLGVPVPSVTAKEA